MLLMAAPMSARADLIHRLTTSTQLSVDGAATQATRIGSTYSVSGNNITAGTMGGLTKASGDNAATAAATQTQGAYSVTTAGSAFSLTGHSQWAMLLHQSELVLTYLVVSFPTCPLMVV